MDYVLLIPLLPALSFALLAPMSNRLRNKSRWISVAAILGSLGLSIAALASTWPAIGAPGHGAEEAAGHGGEAAGFVLETAWHVTMELATLGGVPLNMGLLLDASAAIMVVVVTVVGAGVQIYSIGYMHRDDRVGWYYAVLSLFTAAMLTLVLADNFLLLYMSWEIMGLCSYLLIGFWHEQEAPRRASLKAFMTTRVGDVGFAIGLFIMFVAAGSFEYEAVLGGAASWAPGVALATAVLLLFGAMGKSAQVPLHVWLPDAMAGPTPASALIHAATMVAAGVFLVYRAMPIFEAAPEALTLTMVVGATTALIGGLLAAVQHDIKKVLAYSTISQLGYMFVALGAGGAIAGMYHLVTHAFFKSLLFLGAGVIIHAAHTQDMREMGGLRRYMPWTTATFTAGSLALAGVFPFSGFWSKDEILTVLWHEHHYITWGIALAAAFVTAFYVARLWFRVFTGPVKSDHLEEGHKEMLAPMVVLAAITLVIGFAGPWLGEFLGHRIPWPDPTMAGTGTLVAISGLALGGWAYGRPTKRLNTAPLKKRAGVGYDMLAQKLYFDVTYQYFIVRPFQNLATVLAIFDMRRIDGVVNGVGQVWRKLSGASWMFDINFIDGAVNGLARLARRVGGQLRRIQAGRVQSYQRYVLGALVFLLLVSLYVVKGA